MFILLSSSARPRYREDILRCLAAPEGTCVQFRYSHPVHLHHLVAVMVHDLHRDLPALRFRERAALG